MFKLKLALKPWPNLLSLGFDSDGKKDDLNGNWMLEFRSLLTSASIYRYIIMSIYTNPVALGPYAQNKLDQV